MRESVKKSTTLCDPPRGRDTFETNIALPIKVTNSQYNRGQHTPKSKIGCRTVEEVDDNLEQTDTLS